MYGGIDDRYCNFYNKMGACRHGDLCNKIHFKPLTSRTVLIQMMYPNPLAISNVHPELRPNFDKKYLKKHFERFYADVWQTLRDSFGPIAELRVVDNLCDHLIGNVYIRFERDDSATMCVEGLRSRQYNGVVLLPDLSPVQDFTDAVCKEDVEGACKRGHQCNFLHVKKVGKSLMEKLIRAQEKKKKKLAKKAKEKEGGGGEVAEKEKKEKKDKKDKHRREGDNDDRHHHRHSHRDDESAGRKRGRSPSPPRRETGGGSSSPICHICGKPGHFGRDCALKRS